MKKSIVYTLLVILLLVVAALAYLFLNQRQELNELVEQMEIEKEELQEEYEDLAIQFDGYQSLDIHNDSLQDLLSREQQRVQAKVSLHLYFLWSIRSFCRISDSSNRFRSGSKLRRCFSADRTVRERPVCWKRCFIWPI